MENDPEKAFKTETIKYVIEDIDEEREAKMKDKKMPMAITWLVNDVVMRSNVAHGSDAAGSRLANWQIRCIADVLVSLPENDAMKISRGIEDIIARARNSHKHEEGLITTRHIWIVLMVDYNTTQKVQQEKIQKKIETLKSQQTCTKIPIAIFSANVEDGGVSYESAFLFWGTKDAKNHDTQAVDRQEVGV